MPAYHLLVWTVLQEPGGDGLELNVLDVKTLSLVHQSETISRRVQIKAQIKKLKRKIALKKK